MDYSQVKNIIDRARRIRKRLDVKDGIGTNWFYTFEDSKTHEYIINGVKLHEDIQDDIETAFVWLWSLKDYVKKRSKDKGYTSQWVEDKINSNDHLSICADIANSLKHGGLDRQSRSNKQPILSSLTYSVPQQAIESFTLYASKVVTDVKSPDLVVFKMDVLDSAGDRLGDAFEFLDYGIKAWESIINEVDNDV